MWRLKLKERMSIRKRSIRFVWYTSLPPMTPEYFRRLKLRFASDISEDLRDGVCGTDRVPKKRIIRKTDTSLLGGYAEAKDKEFLKSIPPSLSVPTTGGFVESKFTPALFLGLTQGLLEGKG